MPPKRKKIDWRTPYEKLPPWTVMVYMAAGNSSELDGFAVKNLREMENGVNANATVVVQINRAWPDTPQRYEIHPRRSREGVSVQADSQEVMRADMGDPRTLSEFLYWAVDAYPAQHYLLVLWGHAYGLGFGRDHNDPLTLVDLKKALRSFKDQRASCSKYSKNYNQKGNSRLEILGTNACAMSYVEAAYELRDSAQFMVASQISVPFAGWPYDAILRKIKPLTSPKDLCRIIVNSYTSRLNTPLTGERVEMSILNLEEAKGLKTPLNGLARALKAELLRADDQMLALRDAFLGTVSGDVRPLIDLRDLCEALRELPPVTAAANQMRNAVNSLIVSPGDTSTRPDPPAKTSSRAPKQSADDEEEEIEVDPRSGLGGVGIFAPFVTTEGDLKRLELDDRAPELRRRRRFEASALATGKDTYFKLELFKGKQTWPQLVYNDLRQEIPGELLAFIESVGVTNQSDRIGVAQIIISIESWFNKLDRVVKDAQEQITAELKNTFVPGTTSIVPSAKDRVKNVGEQNNVFGPPSLRLVNPAEIVEKTKAFEAVKTIRSAAGAGSHSAPPIIAYAGSGAVVAADKGSAYQPKKSAVPPLVVRTIGWFMKVESALEGVERATTRGLNNDRFGLGPVAADGFGGRGLGFILFNDETPKSGQGPETPEGGGRLPIDGSQNQSFVDAGSGLEPIGALYRQVARAMQQLEKAVSSLESAAAAVLTVEGMGEGLDGKGRFATISREIGQSFGVVREEASNARRTVRRVVAHPVYGLGPGTVPFGQDAREELAIKNGLSRQHLKLLS